MANAHTLPQPSVDGVGPRYCPSIFKKVRGRRSMSSRPKWGLFVSCPGRRRIDWSWHNPELAGHLAAIHVPLHPPDADVSFRYHGTFLREKVNLAHNSRAAFQSAF